MKQPLLRKSFTNMEASQASSGFAGSAAEDHIRPEYAQMAKDMDFFMTEMHKISQEYIKKCGNPR